jgi:hypothetical protein
MATKKPSKKFLGDLSELVKKHNFVGGIKVSAAADGGNDCPPNQSKQWVAIQREDGGTDYVYECAAD